MQLSHQYSKTKKTKYFGVTINGEFIKLQSKKASISLLNTFNSSQPLFLTNQLVSDSNQVISKITKINSFKLYNYLIKTHDIQHSSIQQSNRSNYSAISATQDDYNCQKSTDIELLPTTRIESSSIQHVRQSDRVPPSVQDSELLYGSKQSRGHKRVLPTEISAFYGFESIKAVSQCVRDFSVSKPGSEQAMQQLRIDLDDARSANSLDDEAVGLIERHIHQEFRAIESDRRAEESDRRAEETDRLAASFGYYFNERGEYLKIGEQGIEKSIKSGKNKRHKAALV